jgi:uncharacterized protein YhjY with autotransporter beta-barrel domain
MDIKSDQADKSRYFAYSNKSPNYFIQSSVNTRTRTALFTGMSIALITCSNLGQSQPLNEVVNELLKFGRSNVACQALFGSDLTSNVPVLEGPLAKLCRRPSLFPQGSTSSGVAGGGAATTAYLPMIVQKRLKKGEDKETAAGDGASADSISDFGNGWNVFLSGEYQRLNRNLTAFEDGYKSDVGSIIAGIDKQITVQLLAGLAINYAHQSGNFASTGNFNNNAYGGTAYASYTPLENLFIQMNAGYAYRNYKRSRFASFTEIDKQTNQIIENNSVSGFADSDYAGQDYNAGILVGYDMNFDSLTIGPRVGFNWVRNDYKSYNETGNSGLELHFNDDYRTSLLSSFGVFASYAVSTSFGVIVPQTGVNWIHEFANNQRDITFSFMGDTRSKTFTFQNERPDRDFLEINAGTSFVLPHGIQAFVNYRGIAGHSYFNSHGVNAGVRLEF